jgi:hypothetical protein
METGPVLTPQRFVVPEQVRNHALHVILVLQIALEALPSIRGLICFSDAALAS